MTRKLIVAVTCVLLAACASSESSESTTQDTEMASTTGGPETTAAEEAGGGAAATITMENLAYSGATSAQVGDTIELVNRDDVPHTFTAEDETFDVSIAGGETATYTFEEAGEYAYFCTIHPSMTGTITVEG